MAETKKNIWKQLSEIQKGLKVPKDLTNKFGNYNYRNAEQILSAVKPLCAAQNCTLVISEDIVEMGNRFYVRSTVTLHNGEEFVSTTGYAREAENKTGMDASQITGAATSYARKYALGGLFGIDDGRDADSMDNRESPEEAARKKKLADAKAEIDNCFTVDDLKKLWNKDITLKTDKEFKELILAKQKELTANN